MVCATVAICWARPLLDILWTSISPNPPGSSIITHPPVGFRMVLMQLRRVVFPQPFWPRIPTMFPLSILNERDLSTLLDP